MSAESVESDPYGIIPPEFVERFAEAETLREALKEAEREPSTTPPRIPTGFPSFGGADDEFDPGGFESDDDLFDTGILSGAEATAQFDEPSSAEMESAMNDVFPGAPDAFEGNGGDDPFAFDEGSIFGDR